MLLHLVVKYDRESKTGLTPKLKMNEFGTVVRELCGHERVAGVGQCQIDPCKRSGSAENDAVVSYDQKWKSC